MACKNILATDVGNSFALFILGDYFYYLSQTLFPNLFLTITKADPLVLIIIFSLALLFWIIPITWVVFVGTLNLKTFRLSLNEEFVKVKQEILSKQDRFIPYRMIQNVILKQDWLDKIFGLVTLTIENAGQLGAANYSGSQTENIGSNANIINCPGFNY